MSLELRGVESGDLISLGMRLKKIATKFAPGRHHTFSSYISEMLSDVVRRRLFGVTQVRRTPLRILCAILIRLDCRECRAGRPCGSPSGCNYRSEEWGSPERR